MRARSVVSSAGRSAAAPATPASSRRSSPPDRSWREQHRRADIDVAVRLPARGNPNVHRSFAPVKSVARVAQTRQDIALLVEPLVDRRRPDCYIRLIGMKFLDTLRRGQQAQEPQHLRAMLLQAIDCG